MKSKTKGMMSFGEIREMVSNSISAREGESFSCYIVDIFTDSVVYESCGKDNVTKYYQCSYAITDGAVILGTPTEVEKQIEYVPLQSIQACRIVGAVTGDLSGNLWEVCLFEFGISKDQRLLFTKNISAASLAKCEGAKIFALRTGQHQDASKFGKPPVDIVAICTKPEIRADGVYAQAAFLPTGYGIRDNLKAAREAGLPDPYGLSVDIDAKAAVIKQGTMKLLTPIEFNSVTVDVVYDPAAGGKFLQMAAAVQASQEEDAMIKKLLAAIQTTRPELFTRLTAAVEAGTMTEDEVINQIAAATVKDAGSDAGNTQLIAAITGQLKEFMTGMQADTSNETQLLACELRLTTVLADSGLPAPSVKALKDTFSGKIFAAVDLENAIKAKKEELDALTQGTGLIIQAGAIRAANMVDQRDKVATMLDDFFDGKVASFKACYQQITGDQLVTGRTRDAVNLQASIQSDTFAEFLGDAITRRALAEYKLVGLDDWKKICDIVPLGDFRTQHRPRMGGYGNLPIVLERGEYEALTTPGDEEATYAPAKRGGTEDISIEAIKNDDVGIIRQVPRALGRSAAWTLYEFVFDFLSGNAAIYDSVALFHTDRGNLASAALDATSLKARRLAMMKQAQLSSGKRLAIVPKTIIVPVDLEDTAYALTVQPNAGMFNPTSADAIRRQTWEIIPVLHWTDATNWYLAADKGDVPLIEIGFLDNKQEPEFFVQDMPNVGSMFSHDILTYKIRHVYGGAVMDYRGFDGSIVAN